MRTSATLPPAQQAESRATEGAANPKRRRFLFTLGVGGAGAALAAKAIPGDIPANPVATSSDDASGYRETEHVRDYYRTAKV